MPESFRDACSFGAARLVRANSPAGFICKTGLTNSSASAAPVNRDRQGPHGDVVVPSGHRALRIGGLNHRGRPANALRAYKVSV